MRIAVSKVWLLGLVVGALAGCQTISDLVGSDRHYIARQVGGDLDDKDAAAIGRKSAEALEWAPAGKSVSWRNTKTGTRAVIVAGKPETKAVQLQTARKKGVATPPNLELVGRTYFAKRNANVRSAPGTGSRIVGGLAKGERFTAIGKVHGGKWLMVGVKGRAIGYVFNTLVSESKKSSEKPSLREELDSEELTTAGFGRGIVVEELTVATACRTVNYTVFMKGEDEPAEEEFRACKASDGAWEID
jgi:surface antigen